MPKSLQPPSPCLQYLFYPRLHPVSKIYHHISSVLSSAFYFLHLIILALKPPLKLSKLYCLFSCTVREELVDYNEDFISSVL